MDPENKDQVLSEIGTIRALLQRLKPVTTTTNTSALGPGSNKKVLNLF
jgi:hypothetical protein